MNAIEITNLNKHYKGFSLKNLSLSLPQGCIMGLIGKNGAGKTTIIKSILGIIKPDSGQITVNGYGMSADIKNDIGVVLDEVGIPGQFNTKDVNKIMKNTFRNWREDKYNDYIRRFELPEKKSFSQYSKGMKMKLGIAAALSHGAKTLILDEPTSGLDPVARDEIIDMLNDFTRNDEHSILISSHIISDLEKICDYIAFLHKGRLIICDEKDVLLEKYGFINISQQQFSSLDKAVIKGKKSGKWGIEALVDRSLMPRGFEIKPVSLEEMFVFMVKEEN